VSRRSTPVLAAIGVLVVVAAVFAGAMARGVLGDEPVSARAAGPIPLVTFGGSEQWSGGSHVRLPDSDEEGLELTSFDAGATSADLRGHWDLAAPRDPGRSALRIRMWVSDPQAFDNKLWASRIDFINRWPLEDASIAWLDRANRPGWNDIVVPLYDLGQVGQPSLSGITGVRVTVYSQQGTDVTVDFAGVDLVSLQ
jgi:hypothetical protein